MRTDLSKSGWYSRAPWRKLRNAYIDENPICVCCEALTGVIVPAKEIDHIIPISTGEEPEALDWDNLQSLCRSCHSKKTRNPNYITNVLHGREVMKELEYKPKDNETDR